MKRLSAVYIKKDGILTPESEQDALRGKLFQSGIPEGTRVEVFMNVADDVNHSYLQLSKIHPMIRELAANTGHSFQDIKEDIKRHVGLYEESETGTRQLKSFGKCSKEELSQAIQRCIEIGDLIGHPVE